MKYVKVKFVDGYNSKQYAYRTTVDLKEGDLVVVEARDTFSVAEVCQVSGFESKATKFVVCKIDLDEFNKNKEKAKRAQDIKKQLEDRRKAVEEEMIWTMLAEKDPVAADLLKELKNI